MSDNSTENQPVVYPSTIPAKVVPPFINVKKFASYTDLEQQMFYAIRQGMLTLMPTLAKDGVTLLYDGTGSYETVAVQEAELFAATIVDSWPTALKSYPQFASQDTSGVGSITGNAAAGTASSAASPGG